MDNEMREPERALMPDSGKPECIKYGTGFCRTMCSMGAHCAGSVEREACDRAAGCGDCRRHSGCSASYWTRTYGRRAAEFPGMGLGPVCEPDRLSDRQHGLDGHGLPAASDCERLCAITDSCPAYQHRDDCLRRHKRDSACRDCRHRERCPVDFNRQYAKMESWETHRIPAGELPAEQVTAESNDTAESPDAVAARLDERTNNLKSRIEFLERQVIEMREIMLRMNDDITKLSDIDMKLAELLKKSSRVVWF